MRAAAALPDRPPPWGLVASLALHGLLLIVLAFLPPVEPLVSPAERSIEVEIVTLPAQPQAEPGAAVPARVPETPSLPPTVAPAATPAPAAPTMVRPTQLLSAATLADPRSREAAQTLSQLAPDDRIEQLCDTEAMDQLHAWRKDIEPDRLIAYAMAQTRLDGTLLQADGAAFRSRRQWYKLKFRCAVTADFAKVASFEFLAGEPVPRNQWSSHNLTPVD